MPSLDHCQSFALSDSKLTCFEKSCNREHNLFCDRCEELKFVLSEIENTIQSHSNTMYFDEQKGEYMHDFGISARKTFSNGKRTFFAPVIKKFTQHRFREKQSEWYAKREMSWHVTSVITRHPETSQLEVCTYSHLIHSCTQDLYSVLSLLENLLQVLHQSNINISKLYLRSDEAGCYHNNFRPASLKDLGERLTLRSCVMIFQSHSMAKISVTEFLVQ